MSRCSDDGTTERYSFASGVTINKDDVIRIVTGAGGGIGDPRKRDRAAVAEDIRNGFITPRASARGLRTRHAKLAAGVTRMSGYPLARQTPSTRLRARMPFDATRLGSAWRESRRARTWNGCSAFIPIPTSALVCCWLAPDGRDVPDAGAERGGLASFDRHRVPYLGGRGRARATRWPRRSPRSARARPSASRSTRRCAPISRCCCSARCPAREHEFLDETVGALRMRKDDCGIRGAESERRHRRPRDAGRLRRAEAGHQRERTSPRSSRRSSPPRARRPRSGSSALAATAPFRIITPASASFRRVTRSSSTSAAASAAFPATSPAWRSSGNRRKATARSTRSSSAPSQAALKAALPGVKAKEVDAAARNVIADAGYGEYFVHRTGHGMGIDGHEPPYITATSETVLEEGMVFSIEPGIYLPGRFGVRLEEIVILREDGPEILSTLPRDSPRREGMKLEPRGGRSRSRPSSSRRAWSPPPTKCSRC